MPKRRKIHIRFTAANDGPRAADRKQIGCGSLMITHDDLKISSPYTPDELLRLAEVGQTIVRIVRHLVSVG